MGHTSSAVKNRYNKKAYKSFNAIIKPELHEKIDTYCKAKGLSRPQFLALAIEKLTEPSSN